jgi:hypothetical protein
MNTDERRGTLISNWIHHDRMLAASQAGCKHPGNAIAELYWQGARVNFLERKRARLGKSGLRHLCKLAAEFGAVTLDVEFKVEPQAPCVPIGRAKKRPFAIDDHELRMIELAGAQPHTAAALEHLPKLTERGPMHIGEIGMRRQEDVHSDTAYRRGFECRDDTPSGRK